MAETTGAQAVADAVKRVADAAVTAVANTPTNEGSKQDFRFSGNPGGNFEIDGVGLGSSGTVKLNGVQLHTTEWGTQHIAGAFPANAKPGPVTVSLDEKTIRHGEYKS